MRSNVPSAPPAPSRPWGAVPGQELVPELFSHRYLLREQFGREQPFEQVVVPEVALGPGQPEHTGDGVGLKHGAHDVLRHPDQSVVAPCAGSKSSADSAPAARIRCSTWTASAPWTA